jgi:hypothetical protein
LAKTEVFGQLGHQTGAEVRGAASSVEAAAEVQK